MQSEYQQKYSGVTFPAKPHQASDAEWAAFRSHVAQGKSLTVVGEELGVTKERVRQLVYTCERKWREQQARGADDPMMHLPWGLYRKLMAGGYSTAEQVRLATDNDLLEVKSLGKIGIAQIRRVIPSWAS